MGHFSKVRMLRNSGHISLSCKKKDSSMTVSLRFIPRHAFPSKLYFSNFDLHVKMTLQISLFEIMPKLYPYTKVHFQ